MEGGDTQVKNQILVDSWGYSMTIIDFYRIKKETDSQVIVEKLESKEVTDGFLTGRSTPVFKTTGDIFKVKKPTAKSEYFKSSLKSGMMHYLELWDGQPQYFNHCD